MGIVTAAAAEQQKHDDDDDNCTHGLLPHWILIASREPGLPPFIGHISDGSRLQDSNHSGAVVMTAGSENTQSGPAF
jgi:hypothetical protein